MAPDIAPAPASGMSEGARLAGVFFEPGKAFADIAANPRWIVPLVLGILAGLAMMAVFTNRVGWERMFRQTNEASSRMAQMTPEQREQALAMQMKVGPAMGYVGAVVGGPVFTLIIAGILLGIANVLFSAELRFKQVFAIACYAGLPRIIFSVLAIVVMFLKNPDDFNLRNPLVFNPGAFMDPTTSSKFLYGVASSLDLFTFWVMLLLAIGLSASSRGLSVGKALVAVAIPWALWVVVSSGAGAVFG